MVNYINSPYRTLPKANVDVRAYWKRKAQLCERAGAKVTELASEYEVTSFVDRHYKGKWTETKNTLRVYYRKTTARDWGYDDLPVGTEVQLSSVEHDPGGDIRSIFLSYPSGKLTTGLYSWADLACEVLVETYFGSRTIMPRHAYSYETEEDEPERLEGWAVGYCRLMEFLHAVAPEMFEVIERYRNAMSKML